MAFYGPNAEHLGNIKYGGWNFSERTNLNNDIFWLLIITSVDFGSLIIGGVLLKIIGGLNVFRIYAQLQSDVGLLLAISQGFMVSWVGLTKFNNFEIEISRRLYHNRLQPQTS